MSLSTLRVPFLSDERLFFERSVDGFLLTGVAVFAALWLVRAPFGRFVHGSHWLWGPKVDGKAAWVVQESVPLFIFPYLLRRAALCSLPGDPTKLVTVEPLLNPATWFLTALYLGHYVHRGLIYPFNAPSASSSTIPVTLLAVLHNIVNGYNICRGITIFGAAPYSDPTSFFQPTSNPSLYLGLLLFGLGAAGNIHSDYHLFHIRRNPPKDADRVVVTSTGSRYIIPTAGLHRYVASPNYLTEMLEWAGFAIATGNAKWAWAFAFFTFANLAPRAAATDEWYRKTFGDKYAKMGKKKLIPFVY